VYKLATYYTEQSKTADAIRTKLSIASWITCFRMAYVWYLYICPT